MCEPSEKDFMCEMLEVVIPSCEFFRNCFLVFLFLNMSTSLENVCVCVCVCVRV